MNAAHSIRIDGGRLAGGIGLIMRRGHIGYCETWGISDKEAGIPMREDAIFRIYSMTKAVTGVAAMMLFEEVPAGIPRNADRGGSSGPSTGKMVLTGTVPTTRQITVLDLMRHTAGFNYTGPHDEAGNLSYQKHRLPMFLTDITSGEFVKRLAALPLVREPGTAWDYGFGTDVLGRLVEVLSGETLTQFSARRIFRGRRQPCLQRANSDGAARQERHSGSTRRSRWLGSL